MNETIDKVWPDQAIHPGEYVQDFFEDEEDIPVAKIAAKSGLAENELWGFIDGEVAVSTRLAAGLSKALGAPADWWIKTQTQYELDKARIEENRQFNLVPYRDFRATHDGISTIRTLVAAGDVPDRFNKVEQARHLCEWLGIPNLDDYEERLLGRFQLSGANSVPNPAPTVAWLRRGELAAIEQASELPPYSQEHFVDAVHRLDEETLASEDAMREICNESGVAFVAPDEIPGCEVRCATRWLDDGRPMIQLKLARGVDDGESVWDTFRRAADRIVQHEPDRLDYGPPASSNGIRADAVLAARLRTFR